MIEAVVAKLYAPKDLRFEKVRLDPSTLEDNQIFAVSEYSAISAGTEKAAYIGLPPLRPGPQYPRLVGYCNVARVEAVGAAVDDVAPGDRIITTQSHRSAFFCERLDVLSTVPSGVHSRAACTAYIAYLGLNPLRRAKVQPGEHVVVQGLGPIGLMAVRLAAEVGADEIIAVGNDAERLRLAGKLGATELLSPEDPDLVESVRKVTDGKFGDVVVTTVNSWEGWQQSMKLVAEHGRIAVVGFPGRGIKAAENNPFAPELFYVRQPTIISAGLPAGPEVWGGGDKKKTLCDDISYLLSLMVRGALSMDEIITHEVHYRELEGIYKLAASGDKKLVVGVLRWDGVN